MVTPTDDMSTNAAQGDISENNETLGNLDSTETVEQSPEPEEQKGEVEGQQEDKSPEDRQAKPSRVELKINKLTRQKAEAREALSLVLEENRRLRQALSEPVKPKEAYANENDYIKDLVNRELDNKAIPNVQRHAEQVHQQYQNIVASEWSEKEAEAMAAIPDYVEVVRKSTAPLAPHVSEAIMDSPVGPYLAYELGKNPEVLAYLNQISPREVDRYLMRLELNIKPQPNKVVAPTSKQVLAPMPTSSGKSGTPKVRDIEELSGEAYLKAYREKKKLAAANRQNQKPR